MNPDPDGLDAGSIAIVGMAGRFPAARTASELWNLLMDGRHATTWKTADELRSAGVPDADLDDPDYVRAALVLPDMEMFDAGFFGFSQRDAAVLDPQHRHFLECAWEALEDAGHMPENFEGAIGVFGGCGMQAYLPYNLMTNPELVRSMGLFLLRHTGNDKDFLASRVSYLLNLRGPSLSIQTACSTSLVAVHVAAQSLLSGECDMALAGGVSIELPHGLGYRYAPGEILSPDGHCRAFDENANGTTFGSGAGIVVLRRLADAVRDGDNIYAVIRGSAVNNDGNQKAGYLAPSVGGQVRAAVEALSIAGVDAAAVSYIEAHGTGTPVGDPIEVAALTQAYGATNHAGRRLARCGIGSIKTNIGHLDTAAGVASLMKVALALRHGQIPATLNFNRPNRQLDIDNTPFRVVNQAMAWPRGPVARIAAVNSLGVGGTNAHVVVQEAPAVTPAADDGSWQVLTLSARTAASLEGLKAKWRVFLNSPPPGFRLADAAYTTQTGRRPFEHRCALVARDVEGLRHALQPKSHEGCVAASARAGTQSVVMMFPGGGAHVPGCGHELLVHDAFRRAVDQCFALMPPGVPADLRAVMLQAPAAGGDIATARLLERPAYAMPALFVLEYALARLWQSWGVVPSAVVGHSAGEYAAACLSGVMSLQDALCVVVLRGQIFEQLPAGAMLAVDLPQAELVLQMADLELDLAAVNAPDLCIASGTLGAIAALEQRLAKRQVECRRLHIGVAAHSRLLDGFLDSFRERLGQIQLNAPTIPFISSLTGTWADGATLTDPQYWVRHLRETVRFADGISRAFELPQPVLLEVGPGQSLGGLARHNSAGRSAAVLASTAKARQAGGDAVVMVTSAAALWTRGLSPALRTLPHGPRPRRVSLPTYAFDHERHWIEPGSGLPGRQPARVDKPLPAEPVIERIAAVQDWFRAPVWRPLPLPAQAPLAGRTWLVFGDKTRFTADIVARLASQGCRPILVEAGNAFDQQTDGSFTLSPSQPSHFTTLFEALEMTSLLPDIVLHLWSLGTAGGRSAGALAGQPLAFDSLMNIGRSIAHLDIARPMQLTVVTAGSQGVEGEAVSHPQRALALGPCRVIPREIPSIRTRLVDLGQADLTSAQAVRCVVDECQSAGQPDLVAWRQGRRMALEWSQLPTSATIGMHGKLRRRGVYLVTGGLGDIGLDLAAFLSSTLQARLVLVGRRNLAPRHSWRTLADSGDNSLQARTVRRLLACEAAGAQVLVCSADVADHQAMAAVVAQARARFGAIHGVFHAAGVLEDGLIATKTAESISRVMSAKAAGAQVLHELLPPGALDLFMVFSSTSVQLAAAGQADYVAANAFVDALAASRADGMSVQWGIWGGQGMAARAYELSRAIGVSHPNTGHPFLGLQVGHGDGAVFEATYAPADLWALQEHAVGGNPVLPGTAYVEIVRAAMAVVHPGLGIDIRAMSFEEAMVFEAQSTRLVRTELTCCAIGYDVVVRSCGMLGEPWVDHARASVSLYGDPLPADDMQRPGNWQAGAIAQINAVAFGPRWHNMRRMQLNGRSAVADMELPERFAGDLAHYAVHPAMTDMAIACGLHLLHPAERDGVVFVPLSIGRIRLVAPLPRRFTARVDLGGDLQNQAVSFDVSLFDMNGTALATFEGFSMRAVKPQALTHQVREGMVRKQSPLEVMLACGIRSEDSRELFMRIFSANQRSVAVSSIALEDLRQRAEAAAQPLEPALATPLQGHARQVRGDAEFDSVERFIADAWRELLGVETLSRDDDFFALGGHSLAAVRLFGRIRKQFAVDLPLATLFQAPTLAALARAVTEQGGFEPRRAAAAAHSTGSAPAPWSPLVAICKGQAGIQPLFCVHGAGGNVLTFKVLSDRLGPAQPFYGLQAQGVDGRLHPLASIEAMAAQYVGAIRTVAPHGPYRLAGYSGGGVIAFEMAQQLTRQGHQVELLAMIDTLSPTAAVQKISVAQKLWLMRRWSLSFVMQWPDRYMAQRKHFRDSELAADSVLRGEQVAPDLVESHLFRSFLQAQSDYQPSPYAGSVTLFSSTEAYTPYLHAGARLGWESHVLGDIHVTSVPGSHVTMLAEPGLSVLADGFRRELARLDAAAPAHSPEQASTV